MDNKNIFHQNIKDLECENNRNSVLLSDSRYIPIVESEMYKNYNVIAYGSDNNTKVNSFILPNILKMNNSFIVYDNKNELYDLTKNILKKNGYKVKCLRDIDGDFYNPLHYLNNEEEAYEITEYIIKEYDIFQEKMERFVLASFIIYVKKTMKNPTFKDISSLILSYDKDPNVINKILKYLSVGFCEKYKDSFLIDFCNSPYFKNILIDCLIKIQPFLQNQFNGKDTMNLDLLYKEKVAIFVNNDQVCEIYSILIKQIANNSFYFTKEKNHRVTFILHNIEHLPKIINLNQQTLFANLIFSNFLVTTTNLGSIQSIYPEWKSIISNFVAYLYFDNHDLKSISYFDKSMPDIPIDFLFKNLGEDQCVVFQRLKSPIIDKIYKI